MDFELQAQARESGGRSSSRKLRRTGMVPAVVYGGGQDPSAIALDHNELLHQMEQESFYTSILTLKTDKEAESVVVKAVQRHPFRREVVHIDLQRIVADEEITLNVPIHYVGEDQSTGVKQQGGVADHLMTDVEVVCLPKDLPSFLEVDVTEVELNQIIHLSDIKLPTGVRLVALEHDSDQAIFAITPPRREEVDIEVEEVEEGEEPTAEEPTDTEESPD